MGSFELIAENLVETGNLSEPFTIVEETLQLIVEQVSLPLCKDCDTTVEPLLTTSPEFKT